MGRADLGNSSSQVVDTTSMCALLARAIDAAGQPVLIIDASDRIVWVNHAYRRLSGFQPEEIVGANAAALRSQHLPENSYAALWRGEGGERAAWCREMIGKRRDGTTYIGEEKVTPLRDAGGAVTHFVSVLHDVTHSRQALQQERLLASQDILTGLAGRAHIIALLSGAIAEAQRFRQMLAVLFVDLDGFKHINDSYGHHIGDAVLKAVAARLRGAVRCSDTVARFGGDEFVILLPKVRRRSVALRIGRQIVEQLAKPVAVGADCHGVSASVGVAFYPQHGSTCESLLISADQAMYMAKGRGGNQVRTAAPTAGAAPGARFRQDSRCASAFGLSALQMTA